MYFFIKHANSLNITVVYLGFMSTVFIPTVWYLIAPSQWTFARIISMPKFVPTLTSALLLPLHCGCSMLWFMHCTENNYLTQNPVISSRIKCKLLACEPPLWLSPRTEKAVAFTKSHCWQSDGDILSQFMYFCNNFNWVFVHGFDIMFYPVFYQMPKLGFWNNGSSNLKW